MRFLDLSKFRNAASLSSGRHASVFLGEGVEFWGLRSYAETDDSRTIDWKASLRSGKTLVKTFVPDRETPVWCVADVSAPMGFWESWKTRFDQAVAIFELIAASSLWSGNRFWAIAYAGSRFRVLTPTLSPAEIRRFLRALRNDFNTLPAEISETVPFSKIAGYVRSKSVVFFLSDIHIEFPLAIRRILKRSHVFSIRISHPYDTSLPKFGIPAISGGFFPRIISKTVFKRKAFDSNDRKPSIPRIEISVEEDPFPALNRLISVPTA